MVDPSDPAGWHDFFVASAGSAAALTGLLFVSLSLHVRFIASSMSHRNTARGSLIGLVMVLVSSLVVLERQPVPWTGVELALVSVLYIAAVGAHQISRYRRLGSMPRATLVRSGLGYLLAIIVWNLQNAWLLLNGGRRRGPRANGKGRPLVRLEFAPDVELARRRMSYT